MKKGPWDVQRTTSIYQDDFIQVNADEVVGPDNNKRTYATVAVKAGVAILAIDQSDRVYLTKQFRYAVDKESIEVVCGGVEPGTDPLTAAKSELEQEVGIRASDWRHLGTIEMDTAVVHCPMHLYVASGLTEVGSKQEPTEKIEHFTAALDEALTMVLDSVITQAVSCNLILKAYLQLRHSE
jgi:ADP-ribose pyrophosphatase